MKAALLGAVLTLTAILVPPHHYVFTHSRDAPHATTRTGAEPACGEAN
jgi:hypothetical protein